MLLCYSNTFSGVIKREEVDDKFKHVNGKRRENLINYPTHSECFKLSKVNKLHVEK
jgi:hypothetical protein